MMEEEEEEKPWMFRYTSTYELVVCNKVQRIGITLTVCVKISDYLDPTALNSSKQVVMDQFNNSQKSYDRLIYNVIIIIITIISSSSSSKNTHLTGASIQVLM